MNPGRLLLRWGCAVLLVQDRHLEYWACRAMRWRAFSDRPIHPKHLFDEQRASFCQNRLAPGISFLDLGSGAGTDCIAARAAGATRIVGLEQSENVVQQARQRAGNVEPDIEFIVHDLEQCPYPLEDNGFDLVNFSNVLEHLDNRKGALGEVKRVMKPGGLAIISIPNADTSWKRRLRSLGLDSRDDPDHRVEYTRTSLREELSQAGLEIITDLEPIIPSLPINGLVALSAALSPALYRRLQQWKRAWVHKNPDETIGWVFCVR